MIQNKSSSSKFLEIQFSIFFMDNLIMDHLTIWEKKLWPLTIDCFWYNRDFIYLFIYFSTNSEIWSPPNFPLLTWCWHGTWTGQEVATELGQAEWWTVDTWVTRPCGREVNGRVTGHWLLFPCGTNLAGEVTKN